VRITVIYDNEVRRAGLRKAHGSSALIEDEGVAPPLSDTGDDAPALLNNAKTVDGIVAVKLFRRISLSLS
jgi:metal-dependent hydrolase (beta-lactamase superfamily II)